MREETFIPRETKTFTKFGDYDEIVQIIESGMFHPTYITGPARSGKSTMPKQACFELQREFIRVNITEQTDEDDLIGGMRLSNGETVWSDGPVIVAMKRGAILLLDEVDYGSEKILCLQPVLEGEPYYVKKERKIVYPADGFNVIVTGNTKGQGDARGKFIGAKPLNEAFLDRFGVTYEHDYPPKEVETKIVKSYIDSPGRFDDTFVEALIDWSRLIRMTYDKKRGRDTISMGRNIHIAKTYAIFRNPFLAVRRAIARFDDSTKDAFFDSFKKVFPLEEKDFSSTNREKAILKRVADDMDLSELNKVRT